MFRIYYLKFTQHAIDTIPKARKIINEHYVLSYKTNFYVMTSKPVAGLKSTFIHSPNIENQVNSKQYVIEHPHKFDPKIHVFEHTSKGDKYFEEHKEKFQLTLESLKNLP